MEGKMTDTDIQQFKIGKYNIDITQLNNFDKVKYVKMETLLKDLIQYREEHLKTDIKFNSGRW